ncbi:hypothetical protein [Streptomyces ortus]|uniref:Uncharacterized protein n=1 Tax=Streptomyces ortus TaxID=2867268 RepID=A0ABT3V105_9ACTN|nr:hypothetical protein [Streptomyces ortus]MCX4232051.1 hypothetical protein [Streptomyces ortus]
MARNNDKGDYEKGAAASRAAQLKAQAAGNAEAARVAAESADANLDRINQLTGKA